MPPSPASAASASRPLDHPFVARYMARPLAVPERAATISARPGIASRAIASRGAGCRWRVWWWSWRFSFGWVVTGPSSRWQTGWPSSSRSRRRAGAVAGHDASRWAKWHLRHRSAPSAPRAARRDPAAGHADARVGRRSGHRGVVGLPVPPSPRGCLDERGDTSGTGLGQFLQRQRKAGRGRFRASTHGSALPSHGV